MRGCANFLNILFLRNGNSFWNLKLDICSSWPLLTFCDIFILLSSCRIGRIVEGRKRQKASKDWGAKFRATTLDPVDQGVKGVSSSLMKLQPWSIDEAGRRKPGHHCKFRIYESRVSFSSIFSAIPASDSPKSWVTYMVEEDFCLA